MLAIRFIANATFHVGLHLGVYSVCSYFNLHEIEAILSPFLYEIMIYELLEFARDIYERFVNTNIKPQT